MVDMNDVPQVVVILHGAVLPLFVTAHDIQRVKCGAVHECVGLLGGRSGESPPSSPGGQTYYNSGAQDATNTKRN